MALNLQDSKTSILAWRCALTACCCLFASGCAGSGNSAGESPAGTTATSSSDQSTKSSSSGKGEQALPKSESGQTKIVTSGHGKLGLVRTKVSVVPPVVPLARSVLIRNAVRAGAITIEEVKLRSISSLLHFNGRIEAEFNKEVDVSSRINGKITQLFARPGEIVNNGQVLATIDSREISEMQAELLEAKSKLSISEAHRDREKQILQEQVQRPASLLAAQAKLEEIKLKKNLAESEFKRQEGLFKEKIASGKDYNTAKEKYQECEIEIQNASVDVQRELQMYKSKALMSKDYQLADAECTREKQHMQTLEQRLNFLGMDKPAVKHLLSSSKISGEVNLRSPANGVISHFDVAVGEIVTPEKSLFKITDLSSVELSFDVPESDLQRVKMGTPLSISVPSYRHKHFSATVSFISDHVNAETRMVPMRAQLDNKAKFFKLNMHADVTLLGEPFEVLACPKPALHEIDGKPCVYRQNGEDFEKVLVTVGGAASQYMEIISGLKEGDKVVTSGFNILHM